MTVVAVLGGDPDKCPTQLECAIAVAKKLGSSVRGLLAMPDPANAVMYFVSAEAVMAGAPGISAVAEAQENARKDFKKAFDACISKAGTWLKAELVNETGHVHSICAAHAILADATVFPREAANSGHALNPVFEYVLMEERLPAIIAAETGDLSGPALIAWDGSPRAMRSIRAHLPLIQSLEHAVIAYNPDKDREIAATADRATPEALADWLREQRVEAKIERFSGKVSEGLLSLSSRHECGLIVMGAYGHIRIGQMLFGGTSRALLHAEGSPALALAH